MGKVGKQELVLRLKKIRDNYDGESTGIGVSRALERCVLVDDDYANFLLFIKEAEVAYVGDNPSCTCADVDADPHYMTFLANTKPYGTSFVFKTSDLNGLPVLIKYEKDRELEIHGVENGQDNESGRSSEALKTNARKNRIVEKQKMKDGILSKKRRNEDRELEIHGVQMGQDNELGRSSEALKTNARKNRMKDEILSKKRGNEDRDLDNRKHRIDGKVAPGKEQKSQNGLPVFLKYEKEDGSDDERQYDCQRNLTNDRELEIHGVENDQDNVREKCKLGSSKALKTYAGKNRNASIVEKRKMEDAILSKKRKKEDRDLGNGKHIIDVKIVPDKEQKIQNDSKFMDVEVKIEPKEDSDAFEEAISQSEVEILENVGADIGRARGYNPFVLSVEHCQNLDATIIDSGYRKEVLNLLMRPYDEEEYTKLWKDIKIQLPSSSTNERGKSLLSLHKVGKQELGRCVKKKRDKYDGEGTEIGVYEKDRELEIHGVEKDKYDGEGTGIGVRGALERCVLVDQDYAKLAGATYDGDNPSCTCTDVDADPHYMTFLANTKPHGTSFFFKTSDLNGLPMLIKYETDREFEIHGVEKDQDNVREKCKLGKRSEALKTNARKNKSAAIVEKQKIKDGILSKKRGNEDRDLDNRKHIIDVDIVPCKEQKMKDGIMSKNRGNEDRGLDNRKQRIDVKIVPGKEQKTQNGSKFMDAGVNIEPKEHSDAFEEAISQREVEILENVGAEESRGSCSNPFVPSVDHSQNLDATIIDFGYRKEVLNLLMRPYDEEEYKKLWKDIKMQLPSSSTNGRRKSLLSRHKAVNRAIKRTNHNKDKKLNIMRGFFFWLEHLTRQDAFQPWEDAECLQTMPRSS